MALSFQSSFSRSLDNMANKGAYYTDVGHCRDIGKLLQFPDTDFDVLEPSCGNCEAVYAVLGSNQSNHLYCVDLDDEVCSSLKSDSRIEKVLCTDFLEGVRIKFRESTGGFQFVFGNPPYMSDAEDGETDRMENRFLRAVTNLLTVGGVLVWVIPLRVFAQDKSLRYFFTHYDIKHLFKFRESEYKKWGQIVVIAVKKERDVNANTKLTCEEYGDDFSQIPELPSGAELAALEKVMVPEGCADNVMLFETKLFNADAALESFLRNQRTIQEDVKQYQNRFLSVPKFKTNTLRDPLVTLSDGHIAQAITCGEGMGLTGTPGVDLHLQRGVCEIVEDISVDTDETNSLVQKSNTKAIQRVESSARVKMTIINPSGSIVHLM